MQAVFMVFVFIGRIFNRQIYKYVCFLYAKLGNANELKEHTAENPVENRNFLGDIFYLLRDIFS